jgi:hypothetical protein
MRTIKRATAVLLAGFACMLLSVAATAAPIDVTSFSMKYSGAPTGTLQYGGAIRDRIYAGEIRLQTSEGPLDAFCIDVTNVLRPGTYDRTSDAPAPGLNFDLIGKLYDYYYESAQTASTSAAFQLALWAIVNNSSTSLSQGFGTAASLANDWLQNLRSADLRSLGLYEFTVLEPRGTSQRLLTAVPVPEPGSLFLLGLGVLGAGAARRFRKH